MLEQITILGGLDKNGHPEKIQRVEAAAGEVLAVAGPTGSGKTQLVSDIEQYAEYETLTGRRVLINNQLVNKSKDKRDLRYLIAQVSQNMNFVIDMPIEEFLTMHARVRSIRDPGNTIMKVLEITNHLSGEPVAFATNLARGTSARGASTIPQQLAKNLFLSRRKTLSRKLEEASLALLLDASLGKSRELEIYLNVIEWGPGVYGLRPAARHYFAREPMQLTPKQMAFLVSLVPGPIKYQRSFEGGVMTPFFEGLVATLLAKLRSVEALTEEEYDAALAAPLELRAAPAAGSEQEGQGEVREHGQGEGPPPPPVHALQD